MNVRYTKFLNHHKQLLVVQTNHYALKKAIQWSCPDLFPDKSFFAFLGPMHFEQNSFSAHGQLIRGKGLDSIIDSSVLTKIGLETEHCDANSIKKARYTVQVFF